MSKGTRGVPWQLMVQAVSERSIGRGLVGIERGLVHKMGEAVWALENNMPRARSHWRWGVS